MSIGFTVPNMGRPKEKSNSEEEAWKVSWLAYPCMVGTSTADPATR